MGNENQLGMELGELWLCAHVVLPKAGDAFAMQSYEANTAVGLTGAFSGGGGQMQQAWTDLCYRYHQLMVLSSKNIYEVCDVLDKVRTSFINVDGMNSDAIEESMNGTIDAYTQKVDEPAGQDLDGDGHAGERKGDFSDPMEWRVVDKDNRPFYDNNYTDPLKGNQNYDVPDGHAD